jgi:hypothetical protein
MEAISPRDGRRWTAHVHRLGEEPPDDTASCTTADQRLAMVWELTQHCWSLTGNPWPTYARASIPVRVLRAT